MTELFARTVWKKAFHEYPDRIDRFQTGSCNYVFFIAFQNKKYTLRMTTNEHVDILQGSLYWIEKLQDFNLPIPKIYTANLEHDPPFAVLNYIEGRDLGDVFTSLTEEQKKEIVRKLVKAQQAVSRLPMAQGFGHLSSYEDTSRKNSWKDVIVNHLERSRTRIRENSIFQVDFVNRIEQILPPFESYFRYIKPVPFFDDITTKNVLIFQGELSGIIDLDWLCFGDRLYVIALTKMALLILGYSLSYVDYWIDEENISGPQMTVLDLYTLIFCVDFMSEKGMRFNKDKIPIVSDEEQQRLIEIYEELYNKVISEQIPLQDTFEKM